MSSDVPRNLLETYAPAPVSELLLRVAASMAVLEQRVAELEDRARRGPAPVEAEWVSPSAAARIADVSPSTIRRWRSEGKLSVGHRRRVNVAELRRVLAGEAPADLASERARRAAATLRGNK